jgi:hypothetical protein
MKKTIIAAAFTMAALASFGQADTTTVTIMHSSDSSSSKEADTIRIGSMVIIKKGDGTTEKTYHGDWNHKQKNKRLQTSWALLDLGYSNYSDKTDYNSQEVKDFTGNVPFNSGDFQLRTGKSLNINVWLFRQRYGLNKTNTFNLTYGVVVETTNFRYESGPSHVKGGPPYVVHDTIDFDKNKLATSYFTIPVMLGFNTNPKSANGFNMSVGASFGYMYSSRNKQISDERGKQKIKGNFNLQPWKVNLVGEVGVGYIKLYGSYSPTSMYKDGLDMRPYTIGVRLGGWD